MASLLGHFARMLSLWIMVVLCGLLTASPLRAAPYAAIVIDARTGEVLHAENAETRLHPASLTKMMTLYIAFEEIERGNISLDSMVTVTKHAAAQPPSRLGLRAGQKIQLRYLIRAAAIKSANDAATAIGEFISGDEASFARRMTRTAHALGMTETTFKNANGLTAQGHLSTARDMTILGRHLFYDFPQYYNLFARRSVDAGLATVNNTNRRFLDAYEGADGIKTGYTVAAGFNLTASAERGGKRLIATIFGGKSTADRNAKMAKLLDKGFGKAPREAPVNPPDPPAYQGDEAPVVAAATDAPLAPARSAIPLRRPVTAAAIPTETPETVAMADTDSALQDGIAGALAAALGMPDAPDDAPPQDSLQSQAIEMAANAATGAALAPDGDLPPDAATSATLGLPDAETLAAAIAAQPDPSAPLAEDDPIPFQVVTAGGVAPLAPTRPRKRNAPIYDEAATAAPDAPGQDTEQEVVISVSTSGERHFGVNLGRYPTSYDAERALLQLQLVESATLGGSLRKVIPQGGGFDAAFVGLTRDQADLACRRFVARAIQCFTMEP